VALVGRAKRSELKRGCRGATLVDGRARNGVVVEVVGYANPSAYSSHVGWTACVLQMLIKMPGSVAEYAPGKVTVGGVAVPLPPTVTS
jgi:hypothetical protein